MADAGEGTGCENQLLAQVVPALMPPPETSGAIKDQPFLSVDFNREPGFDWTVGSEAAPVRPADRGPSPLRPSAPETKTTVERANGTVTLTAPAAPPAPTTPAAAGAIPVAVSDGFPPPTATGFPATTAKAKNPAPGIGPTDGAAIEPLSSSGAGDPKSVTPPAPAGPKGFPAEARSDPGPVEVPPADLRRPLSPRIRSEAGLVGVAEILGRPPGPGEISLPEVPPSLPGAGLPDVPQPVRSDLAGVSLPEANPTREFFRAALEGKPMSLTAPDQIADLPPFDRFKVTSEKGRSAAELPSAPSPAKAGLEPPPLPEDFQRSVDSREVPPDPAASDPGTSLEFSEEESLVGVGMVIKEKKAAVSGTKAVDFSPAAETGPSGAAERGKAAVPPNPVDRILAGQPSVEKLGMIGPEAGSRDAVKGKFNTAPEWPSSPNGALPLESSVAAGQSLEVPAVEGEPKIEVLQTKALFPENPEETNPLYKQLSRGMIRSLQRGEEKIQLALDPPQLGTIFLELHRKGPTVEAQVWTDNPVTKGLLDTQQGQLHKALEQEGFRLDRFAVAVQPDLKSFQDQRWAQERQTAWEGPSGQPEGNSGESAGTPLPNQKVSLFQNGNQYIDTWI